MAVKESSSRQKYIESFNANMVKIWQERIALLGVIRTGALYNSILQIKMKANEDVSDIEFEWGFADYGIYQDRGVGREVSLNNSGDVGRDKIRQRRPWMSKAYYSSTMNLKEFMADSLEQEAIHIVSNAFGDKIEGEMTI